MLKKTFIFIFVIFSFLKFTTQSLAQETCDITANSGTTNAQDGKYRINVLINTNFLEEGRLYYLYANPAGNALSDTISFTVEKKGDIIQRSFDLDAKGASQIILGVTDIARLYTYCSTTIPVSQNDPVNNNDNLPPIPGAAKALGGGTCRLDEIYTALGCISITSPADFVAFILRWAVGIGGGIAFLLMVYSGFIIMTSAGNPERLKGGQELLTSAVTGLIMLIFSIFILRLIGVSILQIPGFGK